jgi:hypothetical protein
MARTHQHPAAPPAGLSILPEQRPGSLHSHSRRQPGYKPMLPFLHAQIHCRTCCGGLAHATLARCHSNDVLHTWDPDLADCRALPGGKRSNEHWQPSRKHSGLHSGSSVSASVRHGDWDPSQPAPVAEHLTQHKRHAISSVDKLYHASTSFVCIQPRAFSKLRH